MDMQSPIVRVALQHYRDTLLKLMKKAEQAGHSKAAREVKITFLEIEAYLGKNNIHVEK